MLAGEIPGNHPLRHDSHWNETICIAGRVRGGRGRRRPRSGRRSRPRQCPRRGRPDLRRILVGAGVALGMLVAGLIVWSVLRCRRPKGRYRTTTQADEVVRLPRGLLHGDTSGDRHFPSSASPCGPSTASATTGRCRSERRSHRFPVGLAVPFSDPGAKRRRPGQPSAHPRATRGRQRRSAPGRGRCHSLVLRPGIPGETRHDPRRGQLHRHQADRGGHGGDQPARQAGSPGKPAAGRRSGNARPATAQPPPRHRRLFERTGPPTWRC